MHYYAAMAANLVTETVAPERASLAPEKRALDVSGQAGRGGAQSSRHDPQDGRAGSRRVRGAYCADRDGRRKRVDPGAKDRRGAQHLLGRDGGFRRRGTVREGIDPAAAGEAPGVFDCWIAPPMRGINVKATNALQAGFNRRAARCHRLPAPVDAGVCIHPSFSIRAGRRTKSRIGE